MRLSTVASFYSMVHQLLRFSLSRFSFPFFRFLISRINSLKHTSTFSPSTHYTPHTAHCRTPSPTSRPPPAAPPAHPCPALVQVGLVAHDDDGRSVGVVLVLVYGGELLCEGQ